MMAVRLEPPRKGLKVGTCDHQGFCVRSLDDGKIWWFCKNRAEGTDYMVRVATGLQYELRPAGDS